MFEYTFRKKYDPDFDPENVMAAVKKEYDMSEKKGEETIIKAYNNATKNVINGTFLPGRFIKIPTQEDSIYYHSKLFMKFGEAFDIIILDRDERRELSKIKKEEFPMNVDETFNMPFEVPVDEDVMENFNEKAMDYFKKLDAKMTEMEKKIIDLKNQHFNQAISDLMTLIRYLKRDPSLVNDAIYFSVLPIYLNILTSLLEGGKICNNDIAMLNFIPEELDDMIKVYNKNATSDDEKLKTFSEAVDEAENPDLYLEVISF